jgi:hypothetical protein
MEIGKYQVGLSHLWNDTPKLIGRFGWAVFLTCQTVAGVFVYFGEPESAKILAISGCIGLFLANMFGHGNNSSS